VFKMATIKQLKEKKALLTSKFKIESERAELKRDIAKIQAQRNKVAPTGWQRFSEKAKPLIKAAMKSTKSSNKKSSKKSNWDFAGGVNSIMGTGGKKAKKMPRIF